MPSGSIKYKRRPGLATPNIINSQAKTSVVSIPLTVQGGEIIDIILDDQHEEYKSEIDIGKIKVKLFYSSRTQGNDSATWAIPVNSSIKQYPLKGEIALLITILGKLYYFGSINLFNSVNNNMNIGMAESYSQADTKQEDYLTSSTVQVPTKTGTATNPNKTFKPKQINSIFVKEGDLVLNGRFGNFIRIGNNADTNSANIKITIKSDTTNEEKLDSVTGYMWLTSDEKIQFTPVTSNTQHYLKSIENKPEQFTGGHAIIGNDRIILNAKKNETFIFSNGTIALNSNQLITLDSAKSVKVYTASNFDLTTDKNIKVVSKDIEVTNKNTKFNSEQIFLGQDAQEPLILGNKLVSVLEDILTELTNLTVPTGTGASGTPINSFKFNTIKQKLKNLILSKKNRTI